MAAEAHHRTQLLAEQLGMAATSLERLQQLRIAIELSPEAANDLVAIDAFLTTINLATRLGPYVPNLEIHCPPHPAVAATPILMGPTLLDQARQLLREATDTTGLLRGTAGASVYDLVLAIGPPTLPAHAYLPIAWQGWRASAGPIQTRSSSTTNPRGEVLAALVAAAMGVAKLMGFMAKAAQPALEVDNTEWRLNVLSLDDSDYAIDATKLPSLPELLLLGAGALAINMAYAARHIPNLVTMGTVLDKDNITQTNANRHTTCLFAQAILGTMAKAPHLAAYLPLRPVEALYDDWKAAGKGSAGSFQLLVTTVDNSEARRSAMSDLPRVTLDAATGGHSLTLMRAANPAGSCGICAYPQPLRQADPSGRGCGAATITPDLPGASVSYVSALAGFLLTGQLVREAAGDPALRPGGNIWHWEDLLQAPPGASGLRTRRSPSCEARHDIFSSVYKAKWPTSGA